MKNSTNNTFVADISVGSNFYALLPRLPNTQYGALAEFIDNPSTQPIFLENQQKIKAWAYTFFRTRNNNKLRSLQAGIGVLKTARDDWSWYGNRGKRKNI